MNSSSLYSLTTGIFIYNIREGKLSPHITTMHVHVVGECPVRDANLTGKSSPHTGRGDRTEGGFEESDEITSVEIFRNTINDPKQVGPIG
jgi:hypothetical protein